MGTATVAVKVTVPGQLPGNPVLPYPIRTAGGKVLTKAAE